MSLEYTIDIQLTELGFPDILQQTTSGSGSPATPRKHDVVGSTVGALAASTAPLPPRVRASPPRPAAAGGGGGGAPTLGSTVDASPPPRPAADGATAAVTSGTRTTGRPAGQKCSPKGVKGGSQGEEEKEDAEEDESTDDSEVSENEDEESLDDEDQDGVDDESDSTRDYRCGVCDLQLPSNMKLQDHMNLHTGQRPHCCAECGKRFCQLNNYRAHLKTHAKAKPQPESSARCRICQKVFRSQDTLKEHLTTTHFEKEFYECDFCKRVFTDRKACELHIEWHKRTQGQFVCDTCGHRFSNQRSLKRHRSWKCQRSFVCTDCSRSFGRKNALLKHSFSHIGLLPYTCLRCACHFRLASLYRQHKCEPQRIHCVACLREFPSQQDFQRHKRDTGCWGQQELKGDEVRCPECGESFATKEELKKHGSAHQRILTCDECGKGFRSALLLMSHMGGHAVQTPCLCQSCGRGFLHQQDYDSHLERCGLAPLPPTVPKKRSQKSSAPPGKPTPLPVVKLPIGWTASTSGSDPTCRLVTTSKAKSVLNVPAPSPESQAEGSWRLTLDKPPPLGLNLVLFVPVDSPLAAGLAPTVHQTQRPAPAVQTLPPAPAVLDAAVELHRSTSCSKTSSVVRSPLEVVAPLDLVANKTRTQGYVAPLDLSNKSLMHVVCTEKPAVSIKTPSVSIKTPAASIQTPPINMKTPAASIEMPAVSIETPAVSIKTPAVSIETPAISIKTPAVSIETPAVSIKTPAAIIKTPAVRFKTSVVRFKGPIVTITAEPKECRVILRKFSGEAHGVTGDTFSCVNRKTEICENVGNTAHNNNILATVKPEPVGMAPLVMDIKEEPKSPYPVFDELQS